jgi:hypothetical protein
MRSAYHWGHGASGLLVVYCCRARPASTRARFAPASFPISAAARRGRATIAHTTTPSPGRRRRRCGTRGDASRRPREGERQPGWTCRSCSKSRGEEAWRASARAGYPPSGPFPHWNSTQMLAPLSAVRMGKLVGLAARPRTGQPSNNPGLRSVRSTCAGPVVPCGLGTYGLGVAGMKRAAAVVGGSTGG